jgi:glycosyltransferase involved in cell wall biosynthesis
MRVGFYYHIPVLKKKDGSIWMPGYLGVFIDGLAKEVSEVICYMHNAKHEDIEQMDYRIESSNVRLVSLPHKTHMLLRLFQVKKYLRPIKKTLDQIDIMLIRGPSPLLPNIASLCNGEKRRYAFLLVGDYLKSLHGIKDMHYLKYMILNIFYRFNKHQQDKTAANALLVTNNPMIREDYELKGLRIHEIRTTTLKAGGFFDRKDTCQQHTIRLAYAGRIDPAKGIDDMLQAIYLLKDYRREVELHIAGWDPSGGRYLEKLKARSKELKISDKLFYHGRKKVGEDLMSFYRACDIFIIATKGNEGFPRTIWEAMSQGTPVVATKVGSIPKILSNKENVLLIEESSPDQIAGIVKMLIEGKEMRMRLIFKGMELSLTNTIEVQSKRLSSILQRECL